MLDGTRLFVGDALTAPGTALWIGWMGDKDLADLPLRGKAEEVVRICVSQALTLEDDDIDWDLLQRTPRWASHKPTHLLIAVALVTTIRNRITGYKPSATEICQILGVLTMYTDRESAHEFNSVIRVARNLLANLSREELKDFLRTLLADGGSKYDGPRTSGFQLRPCTRQQSSFRSWPYCSSCSFLGQQTSSSMTRRSGPPNSYRPDSGPTSASTFSGVKPSGLTCRTGSSKARSSPGCASWRTAA